MRYDGERPRKDYTQNLIPTIGSKRTPSTFRKANLGSTTPSKVYNGVNRILGESPNKMNASR
jgi:hypothetical protein